MKMKPLVTEYDFGLIHQAFQRFLDRKPEICKAPTVIETGEVDIGA